MPSVQGSWAGTLSKDCIAGLVVFLVALPLCLGVALASNAPAFSGILAGIVGGILVGLFSGSQTSVSGPAAGLTAIVAAQIAILGSFQTFLLAVAIAGVLQLGLGLARAGIFAVFVPSSVIKGLLAAIGVILIMNQIPHVFGHDADPEVEMASFQPNGGNTFPELFQVLKHIEPGAAVIGLVSIVILFLWGRWKTLKYSPIPSALVVVLFGIGVGEFYTLFGEPWILGPENFVRLPKAGNFDEFLGFFQMADFSQWSNKAVYVAAFTIAAVASLETLLNLEAVDKLDPKQRVSPPNRELFAQGLGNIACGLIGGLPVTSVIVRSSVNINAGARTKLSAIFHGVLLLFCAAFLPSLLNRIPLSCLAAILFMTGIKLASPALLKQMWKGGHYQFIPFIVTLVGIVLTDLLLGVVIGLVVSLGFVLKSNLRRPLHTIVEKHHGGDVVHIQLANQVSFLNRAALTKALEDIPSGGHVLLDAQSTYDIDPDILALIREFRDESAAARGVNVSLLGFREKYDLQDQTQYVDYSTRELQEKLTPEQVLQILKDGHDRFKSGQLLTRDYGRVVTSAAQGQHPLAVVLSCIDSRTPAEIVFDLGVGDIFVARIAGNIAGAKILGSIEFACAVAGAKLVLVMGHTGCGAVAAAVGESHSPTELAGCGHLRPILVEIQKAIRPEEPIDVRDYDAQRMKSYVDEIARRNVERTIQNITEQSTALRALTVTNQIAIVGAMYDVITGTIEFFE